MGFVMLPNGCSWYETNKLGGCLRRARPRAECREAQPSSSSSDAAASHRLAIIVPYRSADNRVHLEDVSALCRRMSVHLKRSRVAFEMFIINQVDARPFNRGALVNAAVATIFGPSGVRAPTFRMRSKEEAIDYMAVHDIDRYPVAHNDSGCSSAVATYYTYPSPAPRVLHPTSFAGGVLLLSLALFRSVNGFSNAYFGWGEEDNDLFLRLRWCGLPPRHAERIDWCMEHRDCVACKRQKQALDASILHAHERRMRKRLPHPRRHMLRDGLATLNFTLQRAPQRLRCGPLTVTTLDVDLSDQPVEATDGSTESEN